MTGPARWGSRDERQAVLGRRGWIRTWLNEHDPDGPPNPPAANPPDLGELLAAAVRGGAVDAEAERRVLAAFRAARDEGAHRAAARNRRRDDWRPERERRGGRPVRTTLVALVASVTLGGVAVAAIGSVGGGTRDEGAERGGPLPASSAPTGLGDRRAESVRARAGRPWCRGRPSSAQDTEAHCRAYDSVKKRGKALDSTAWQRLIQAAGGEENVEAYCAEQLAEKKEKKKEKGNADKGEPSKSPKASRAPGKGATKNAKSAESTEPEGQGRLTEERPVKGCKAGQIPSLTVPMATAGAATPHRRGPGRRAARAARRPVLASASEVRFVSHPTPERDSCTLYGHGRGTVSRRNVPFAPDCGRPESTRGSTTATINRASTMVSNHVRESGAGLGA